MCHTGLSGSCVPRIGVADDMSSGTGINVRVTRNDRLDEGFPTARGACAAHVHLRVPARMSVRMPMHMSMRMPIHMSMRMPMHMSMHMSSRLQRY